MTAIDPRHLAHVQGGGFGQNLACSVTTATAGVGGYHIGTTRPRGLGWGLGLGIAAFAFSPWCPRDLVERALR
jgi:hypothetical protein